MAKAKEAESIRLCERPLHIVGSLEIDSQPHMQLHLIAGAQDTLPGQATGYGL
ncbi:hypothetical protein D3C85_1317550 [compost metagenome]